MVSRKGFVLEEFFAGAVSGWGFTHSRFGKLQNRFTVDAKGTWDPSRKRLALVEKYQFDDGHQDTLQWDIEKISQNSYVGSESRIKGTAKGEQSRLSYRWRYTRDVPAKNGSSSRLSFDDCFLLQEQDVLIANATISKFGIQIATITAFYMKRKA